MPEPEQQDDRTDLDDYRDAQAQRDQRAADKRVQMGEARGTAPVRRPGNGRR